VDAHPVAIVRDCAILLNERDEERPVCAGEPGPVLPQKKVIEQGIEAPKALIYLILVETIIELERDVKLRVLICRPAEDCPLPDEAFLQGVAHGIWFGLEFWCRESPGIETGTRLRSPIGHHWPNASFSGTFMQDSSNSRISGISRRSTRLKMITAVQISGLAERLSRESVGR
jgi:hypothetical protein